MKPIAERTLEDLEGTRLAPPYASPMVARIAAARRVPVSLLTAGQLRLLLGQGEGVRYLLPIAVTALEREPLIEADNYPGDLLLAVLRQSPASWQPHSDLRDRVGVIANRALNGLGAAELTDAIRAELWFTIEQFG